MEHCPTMGNIFEKPKDISNKIIHFGVKCDGCGKFPIVGCRYKCAVCDDFDYCEDCEKKLSEKLDFLLSEKSKYEKFYSNYRCPVCQDKGRVDGISGNIDLDEGYIDYAKLIKEKGFNGFTASVPVQDAPAAEPVNESKTAAVVLQIGNDIYKGTLTKA